MNPHRVAAAFVALGAAGAGLMLAALVERPAARILLPLVVLLLVAALVYAAAGGPGAVRVGAAMFRRSLLTYRSYRAQVASVLVYTSLTVLLFYLAAGPLFRLLLGVETEDVPRSLVALLTVGLVTWPVFWRSWELTTLGVRQEQWEGTLESVVPMPNGTRAMPFGYLVSKLPFTILFQVATLTAIMLALPGSLYLKSPRSILDFAAIVTLTVSCMWGLGLLFGGLAILYKQLGPADLVVRTLFLFLAGIFLPTEIFPVWAQRLAEVLPLTHAYRLLHAVVVDGVPLGESPGSLVVLTLMTTLAVVAGNVVYHRYIDKARRQGAIQGY